MQTQLKFEENIKLFYTSLNDGGHSYKQPSGVDLWNEITLNKIIELVNKHKTETKAEDILTEANRRIGIIKFYNNANNANDLPDINKLPDDMVNLLMWFINNTSQTDENAIIKLDLSATDKGINISSNLGSFCDLNGKTKELYEKLKDIKTLDEAVQKQGKIIHKIVDNHFNKVASLKYSCIGCENPRCIKRTLVYFKYLSDTGMLDKKLKEREEYIAKNGPNNIFEYKWNYDTGFKYVTEENLKFAQELVKNNAVHVSRGLDKHGRVTISLKVGCDEIRELMNTTTLNKEEMEKRNWVCIYRDMQQISEEENTCANYTCQNFGCPFLIAGYIYYLKKIGKLDEKLKEDREFFNRNKEEAINHIYARHDKRMKDLKQAEENKKKEIRKSLEIIGCKINNTEFLLDALQNKTQKSLYCIIEGEPGLRQDRIVNAIADGLRKNEKIKATKDKDNELDYVQIPLTGLAGSSLVYLTGSNSYQQPRYYQLTERKLYILTGLKEFLKDYKTFKENKESFKARQLTYILDLLGDIKPNTYVIIMGEKNEINELLELSPKIKYVYQELHLQIENLTMDELFQEYKNGLEKTVYDKLILNQDNAIKIFKEYIITNRNQLPFKNTELSNYLSIYSNAKGDVVFPPDAYVKKTLDESLNAIIGLDSIKEKIKEFEKYTDFNNKARSIGMKLPPQNLHMVFTGNAGCGKTTLARIIAKMLYDIGLLKENKLIEVDRKDLVGQYIGQTAPKTNEIIEKALGGVLFIDEAYTLTQYEGKDFGAEAIATLMKAMEDKRDELVVIFAGYPNEMAQFIEKNPGMASRIGYTFEFPDYTIDELTEIYMYKMKKMGFELDEQIEQEVKSICGYFKRKKSFGNGRFIDKLIQETIMNHSRLCTNEDINKISIKSLPEINELSRIKMGESSVEEPLKDIIGLESLKERIKEFEKYVVFTKNAQKSNLSIPSRNMHMIFTGNPGTGKTTIARIMAKMLFDIGILGENKLIEVDRKDLVGQYVGQTAPKTNEVINKALGGVLFIDEAYALTQNKGNDFGAEAIATLIKAMEDHKDDLVVIFAGYKDEMGEFVSKNPGMASRIGYTFDFPDYTENELCEMLIYKMTKSGFEIEEKAKNNIVELMKYFSDVENVGNGRFVDKVIQETLIKHSKHQDSRIELITAEDIPTVNEMTENIFNGANMINPDTITEESLRKTAYHEIGHAFVKYKLTNSPGIKKISIKANGAGTLGRVEFNQTSNHTNSKKQLMDNICVLLAGMAGEEIFMGEFKNGNTSDLSKATHIANLIITRFGMSSIGFACLEQDVNTTYIKPVYDEANKILKECYEQTKIIINDNKRIIEKLSKHLLDKKEMNEEEFLEIIEKEG